jgi:hypothetical protein
MRTHTTISDSVVRAMPTAEIVGPEVTAFGLSVLNVQPIAKFVPTHNTSVITEYHCRSEQNGGMEGFQGEGAPAYKTRIPLRRFIALVA